MRDRLIQVLIKSNNEAADDLFLDALRMGNEGEPAMAIDALMTRKTTRGLGGMIADVRITPDQFKNTHPARHQAASLGPAGVRPKRGAHPAPGGDETDPHLAGKETGVCPV